MPSQDTLAGRYQILGRIAAGGMGEVYRARMTGADGVHKAVALKVVREDLASDPDLATMFVDEARVAMRLSHANVVHSFDVGRIDDRYFIAMELVDGVDLRRLIRASFVGRGQSIPVRHVLTAAVEALKGLDYAHRLEDDDGVPLGIVHRDVSPANVLVSYEGEVKVADFGIAKSLVKEEQSLAGSIKGKVAYMAPEQLEGGLVGPRADLYSMGVVLYELLTGKRPFGKRTAVAMIPDILAGVFPRPTQIRADIPVELEAVVLKAMSRDPADRHSSAATLRQELERLSMAFGHLLSSTDLADFVSDMVPRQPKSHIGKEEKITAVDPPPTALPGASDGPFDLRLGEELRRVQSDAPVSVFVTRSATPAAMGFTKATVDSHAPVEPTRARRRPRGRAAWLAAGLCAAVVGGVALVNSTPGQGEADGAADSPPTTVTGIEGGETGPAPATETRIVGPEGESARETDSTRETGGNPVATAPAEAAPPDTPSDREAAAKTRPHRPRGRRAEREAASREPATLSIASEPWAFVTIDGQRVGRTTLNGHSLSAGRHVILLRNPAAGLERRLTLELRPGESRRLSLSLRENP